MFKITKLRTELLSNKSESINDLYGFEYDLDDGFNIIAGPNSRGKTTINTCIYYALGMEELLGGHNEKALDKSLKEEFSIKSKDNTQKESHIVETSKVLLEIKNGKGKVACLERYIKPENSEIKTSNIFVYYIELEGVSKGGQHPEVYYVNSRGNNEDPNGFYSWLSDFSDIELPIVSNKSKVNDYSPLYLQTIFSTLFIEQTKGWSDFFATMPFFGIPKAKEKVVEFILDLEEIRISTQKDVLNKEKNLILQEWRNKIKSVVYLEKQTNSEIINIPVELTIEQSAIDKISVWFSTDQGKKVSLDELLLEKQQQVLELENKPLSSIKENREQTIREFSEQKEKYAELKQYIDDFENRLHIDKHQLKSLLSQLDIVENEIKDHLNLKKVFTEKIINERGVNHCPTCSQEVTTDLISTNNIRIPQLTLEENTNFLKSQKKIIATSIDSLKETLKEKEMLLLHFKTNLRQKEVLIKSLSKDLIADNRAFSEAEVIKKVQLEKEVESGILLKQTIQELKNELEYLANKARNNALLLAELDEVAQKDKDQLQNFENNYKDLLFNFGYDSNEQYRIFINGKEPFKYFPVYRRFRDDKTPQSIRINSSASDFVRNLWAYTLALLVNGKNHPGVIIFDEPGQHRTNLNSLKKLFKYCSTITNNQVIIFTSIDKPLNNDENERIDLDILIDGLEEDTYNLIRLNNEYKVIQRLIS